MPAFVRKKGNKYRVVEKTPKGGVKIVKNKAGTAVDGSGHTTKTAAEAQARAINASQLGKDRR